MTNISDEDFVKNSGLTSGLPPKIDSSSCHDFYAVSEESISRMMYCENGLRLPISFSKSEQSSEGNLPTSSSLTFSVRRLFTGKPEKRASKFWEADLYWRWLVSNLFALRDSYYWRSSS